MPYGERPKVLTALLVLWAAAISTWVISRVFGAQPPDVPGGTVAALTAVMGLPPVVFGLYQWARSRSERDR